MTERKPTKPLTPVGRHEFQPHDRHPMRCAVCGYDKRNRVHR